MLKLATKFAPEPHLFAQAVEAGFQQAEFYLTPAWLERSREIIATARQFPLTYALHFPTKGEMQTRHLRATAELYWELDASAVVMHQREFDRYGAELLQISPQIRVGIENHRLSRGDFWRWAEQSPGLTFDVEHLWMFTLQDGPLHEVHDWSGRLIREFGHKLRHVHLPGYVAGLAEHRPMVCGRDFVLPVFDQLADIEYNGLVVSEVNSEFQNPYDLRMDVLLYERWLHERTTTALPRMHAVGA